LLLACFFSIFCNFFFFFLELPRYNNPVWVKLAWCCQNNNLFLRTKQKLERKKQKYVQYFLTALANFSFFCYTCFSTIKSVILFYFLHSLFTLLWALLRTRFISPNYYFLW
jgi:hypothetical protein